MMCEACKNRHDATACLYPLTCTCQHRGYDEGFIREKRVEIVGDPTAFERQAVEATHGS